jgi:transposase
MAARTLAGAQKKCRQEARTPVFVDESGFYLLPSVVSTYAPIGQTPVLEHTLTREHLSVIGGITPDGRLFTSVQEESFISQGCIDFLEHLQRQIPGKLLVIWDGAPIHRSKAIKEYLAQGAAKRLQLEPLPAYAPDLNPEEGVWQYLKYTELKNVCCQNMAHLKEEFVKARERLRHKKHIIQACFKHAGCH